MSNEREDLEGRLRHELTELAHSAPARDETRPATRDPRRGRALLAAAAIVVVIAVIASLAAARNNASAPATPPITRVQLALAPITGRTNPPCRAAKVLDPASEKCLTLAAPVARNADVVAATVAYITQDLAWAVVMTLDAPALARIAALTNPSRLEVPPISGFPQGLQSPGGSVGFVIPEVAVVVDGRVVDIENALVGGNVVQIVRPRQTRAAAIALAASITGRTPAPPSAAGLTVADHWHVALGVDDCGTWVPNWEWPPGNTTNGAPARAGSRGRVYAGLHSHGDGLIHMEAASSDETGDHATLGLYFRFGGWHLSADALRFTGVDEKNGNQCDGKPGVLRWSVNGKEHHGDPADYLLRDGDVVELVFTNADASMPPKTAVPSYRELEDLLGVTP